MIDNDILLTIDSQLVTWIPSLHNLAVLCSDGLNHMVICPQITTTATNFIHFLYRWYYTMNNLPVIASSYSSPL